MPSTIRQHRVCLHYTSNQDPNTEEPCLEVQKASYAGVKTRLL